MAEVEQAKGSGVGAVAGLLLLLFAGGLVAVNEFGVTDSPSLAQERDALAAQPGQVAKERPRSLLSQRPDSQAANARQLKKDDEKKKKSFTKELSGDSSSGSSASLTSLASSDSSLQSFDSLKSSESGSLKGHPQSTAGTASSGSFFGSYLFHFLVAFCYAFCYKSKVVDKVGKIPHQDRTGKDDFEFGLCDCMFNINMCIFVFCCPWVRMAHTNEAADVCGYWETFCCMGLSMMCCGLGPCCLTVYFRIHLKDHLGIEDHCFNDMCVAFCCPSCVIGQQGLAVDKIGGYEVACPCDVKWNGGRREDGF